MSKRKSFPGRGVGGGMKITSNKTITWNTKLYKRRSLKEQTLEIPKKGRALRSWEKNYSIFFQEIDTGFFSAVSISAVFVSEVCILGFRISVHSFLLYSSISIWAIFFGKFFNSIVINLDLINIYVFTQICNYIKLPFRFDNT